MTDKSNELTAIPKLLQRLAPDYLDQMICIGSRWNLDPEPRAAAPSH